MSLVFPASLYRCPGRKGDVLKEAEVNRRTRDSLGSVLLSCPFYETSDYRAWEIQELREAAM